MTATRRETVTGLSLLAAVATITKTAHAQQVPAPTSPADVPGTPSGTIMTKEYVAMVGSRGYKPTERSRKGVTGADKIERLLRQAARELYL